jgi:hypothetical protein
MTTQRSTATGPIGIVSAIFSGGVSALLFSYALAHAQSLFMFFMVYITSLPIFLAGLAAGSLAGLVASLSAVVGLFFAGESNIALLYTFIFAVPSTTLIMLALRSRVGDDQKRYWYPEGYLLTAATLYPCVIFVALALLTSSHPGGLLGWSVETFNEIASGVIAQMQTSNPHILPQDEETIRNVLPFAAKIAPAILGWTWMIVTIISLVAAQKILQKQNWNLRTPFVMTEIHLPSWFVFVLAAMGLMGYFAPSPFNYYGQNIAFILGMPLVLSGIAVIHTAAARSKYSTAILTAFYIVLSVFVFILPIIALLGVCDQLFQLRDRFRHAKPTV